MKITQYAIAIALISSAAIAADEPEPTIQTATTVEQKQEIKLFPVTRKEALVPVPAPVMETSSGNAKTEVKTEIKTETPPVLNRGNEPFDPYKAGVSGTLGNPGKTAVNK